MNILLGYANSLSRDFAQRYLGTNQSELNITTAGTLSDCLQLANDFTSLDVVGLDLEMPDMDGISGFRKFRQAPGRRLPVAPLGSTPVGREARDRHRPGAA